jgi:hypothetical protein
VLAGVDLDVAWCAGLAAVGYLWARAAFNREPRPR